MTLTIDETLTADERLKNKWAAIFRRTGGDGVYTRLFDNLDAPHRSKLLTELKPQDSEVPVIGSLVDSRNWLILTTRRLVWCMDAERQEIPVSIISDATADSQQFSQSGTRRDCMRRLLVATTSDSGHHIEVETGAALSGMRNILKSIAAPYWKEERLWSGLQNVSAEIQPRMIPLLYRGILILIGAGLMSALIAANLQLFPSNYRIAAFTFIAGMLGTAIIVLIRLHRKRGAKLVFPESDASPWGCLAYIVGLPLSLIVPGRYEMGDAVIFFFFGAFAIWLISRFTVGEAEK